MTSWGRKMYLNIALVYFKGFQIREMYKSLRRFGNFYNNLGQLSMYWLKYVYQNSPIHTLQKAVSLCRVKSKVKRVKPNFPFLYAIKYFASWDEISLNMLYSFDVWVVPSWGNQNIKRKREIRWETYGFSHKDGAQRTLW